MSFLGTKAHVCLSLTSVKSEFLPSSSDSRFCLLWKEPNIWAVSLSFFKFEVLSGHLVLEIKILQYVFWLLTWGKSKPLGVPREKQIPCVLKRKTNFPANNPKHKKQYSSHDNTYLTVVLGWLEYVPRVFGLLEQLQHIPLYFSYSGGSRIRVRRAPTVP